MPPTTLTLPDTERCGAALLEEAPRESQDELGPVDQTGDCTTGPRDVLALVVAGVFGKLLIVQSPCATSRTDGPRGAPMPSLDEPTRLTIAENTETYVYDDGPKKMCHKW